MNMQIYLNLAWRNIPNYEDIKHLFFYFDVVNFFNQCPGSRNISRPRSLIPYSFLPGVLCHGTNFALQQLILYCEDRLCTARANSVTLQGPTWYYKGRPCTTRAELALHGEGGCHKWWLAAS